MRFTGYFDLRFPFFAGIFYYLKYIKMVEIIANQMSTVSETNLEHDNSAIFVKTGEGCKVSPCMTTKCCLKFSQLVLLSFIAIGLIVASMKETIAIVRMYESCHQVQNKHNYYHLYQLLIVIAPHWKK
jgi:hypothetical protein